MDTISFLQEQINDLQKRVEVLEKQKRKRTWTKNPPLTPEEVEKAKSQILPLFIRLEGQAFMPREIMQRTALLRRLGTIKVREHLETQVEQGIFIKNGTGKSALYTLNPARTKALSKEDLEAKNYILNLQQGIKLDTMPKGKWEKLCSKLTQIYEHKTKTMDMHTLVQSLIASNAQDIQTLFS